jgi:hypothetical protein
MLLPPKRLPAAPAESLPCLSPTWVMEAELTMGPVDGTAAVAGRRSRWLRETPRAEPERKRGKQPEKTRI